MFRLLALRCAAQMRASPVRLLSRVPRRKPTSARQALPLESVVKVFTVASSPNYFLPWQNKGQVEKTGSGFAISGRRLLTNAHVVADSTYVMVRRHGSSTKYTAKVESVGHECDIALLTVADESFWTDVQPLEFGGIPALHDTVTVVGYPIAGDNVSVTVGVVSRVEPQQYTHGAASLLAVQIDAAINPGNSGGPVLQNGEVVGIAFQALTHADNIGFIIPTPIVRFFLDDIARFGQYRGFCVLGVRCQALDNVQIRQYLQLPTAQTGVLVNTVYPLSPAAAGGVRPGDVLLAFDGIPIANDGSVPFRDNESIMFDYLISQKHSGERAELTVLRGAERLTLPLTMQPYAPLVPVTHYDRSPSYIIYAGLVFTALTQPFLHEYGPEWYHTCPRKLWMRAMYGVRQEADEQVVILSQVLVDEASVGYQHLCELELRACNGVRVRNMVHLQQLLAQAPGPFIRFDLDDDRVIVLQRNTAAAATRRILERHRIASAVSNDLPGLPLA